MGCCPARALHRGLREYRWAGSRFAILWKLIAPVLGHRWTQTQMEACTGDPVNVPGREWLTSGARREDAASDGRCYTGRVCVGGRWRVRGDLLGGVGSAEKGIRARGLCVQTCGGVVGAGGSAGVEGCWGSCEGKRWGHRCPNQGLLCPREQAGPGASKGISVHFSAAQSLLWDRGFPGRFPSQRWLRNLGLCDAATFQRRGEAGGHMRPSPGQPGTGFHVHSPVVGWGPSPLPPSQVWAGWDPSMAAGHEGWGHSWVCWSLLPRPWSLSCRWC